jgi:hypothetical protein
MEVFSTKGKEGKALSGKDPKAKERMEGRMEGRMQGRILQQRILVSLFRKDGGKGKDS